MGQLKNKRVIPGRPALPSVNLERTNREWRTVKVSDLQLDDIIAGRGIVKMIFEACDYTWYLEAGEVTEEFFEPTTEFFAFVRKEN